MYTKLAELFRRMITYFSLFPIWTSSVGQGSGSIVSILSDSMNMVLMALVDQWTSRLTMADLDLVVQYWWHFDVEWKKIADIAVIPALLEVFSFLLILGGSSGSLLDWSRNQDWSSRILAASMMLCMFPPAFTGWTRLAWKGKAMSEPELLCGFVWSVMGMAYSGCVTSIDCFWIICCGCISGLKVDAFVLSTSWWEERGGKCFSNPCLSEHVRTWDSWTWQSIRCISIPCTVATVILMCTCALMHVHSIWAYIYIYICYINVYTHMFAPSNCSHISWRLHEL